MKLLLIRHPAVAVAPGHCYGASDVELADGWQPWCEQVKALVDAIDGDVACVSSPLSRCLHPARRLGRDVSADLRLREMDFGDWEGGAWSEIAIDEISRWNADLMTVAPPNGESLGQMHARTEEFLGAVRGFDGDALVAITHAGPIRCLLASVLGMDPAQLFRLRVDLGSVSTVSLGEGGDVLEFMNLRLQSSGA
jgi:alpha-ribazole phosphatase